MACPGSPARGDDGFSGAVSCLRTDHVIRGGGGGKGGGNAAELKRSPAHPLTELTPRCGTHGTHGSHGSHGRRTLQASMGPFTKESTIFWGSVSICTCNHFQT